jgi:hypothetical protein
MTPATRAFGATRAFYPGYGSPAIAQWLPVPVTAGQELPKPFGIGLTRSRCES